MSAVLESTEKILQNGKAGVVVNRYRFSVEIYDLMIEHGILTKYDKVELLEGKIYEKHTAQPFRISVKMYDAMIEKGILDENDNVELLDGEIFEKMPKGTKHTSTTRFITSFFYRTLNENIVIQVQDPILLEDSSEPEPDIVLARPDVKNYTERHPTPDDILLIIEVSDLTLQFDRRQKGLAYSQAGIEQYLIVNAENNTIEDYRKPDADGYQSKQTYEIGEKISLIHFPELEIAAADFFA